MILRLFDNDKKAVANHITNQTSLISSDDSPTAESMEEEYTKIFGGDSKVDNSPARRVDYGSDSLYGPITKEDTLVAIRSTSPSASGPDGITIADLKKANIYKVQVQFNAVLYSGYVPTELKNCRITLIPKKGNL